MLSTCKPPMLEEGEAQAPTLLLCNLSLLVALLPSWLTKKTQTQHHLCKDPTALTTRVCNCDCLCHSALHLAQQVHALLEGDEARRVGGANTWPSMGNGLVGDGKLAKVATHHCRLDVDGVEGLAVVDADNGADHVREDDDIAEVGVHDGGLLVLGAVGLGLAQLLHQSDGALGQAAGQSAALARAHHSGHLGLGLLEKVLEVNTAVAELAEGPLAPGRISLSLRRHAVLFQHEAQRAKM
mmetsp:Transcript_106247/g.188907  ORF Transcript_106247/g.188907 Transcript_106247/m.188907 type:complete len:240 (+) Transcript_106247:300-1019(+)